MQLETETIPAAASPLMVRHTNMAMRLTAKFKDAWSLCIPPFLDIAELSNTSQLCKEINKLVQHQLERLRWWTVGEDGWEKGLRVCFRRPTGRQLLSRLQDMSHVTHVHGLPFMVKLPDGLRDLTIMHLWSERVEFPSSLRSLTFGPEFNASLQNVKLPEGLERLAFGIEFDQSMEGVSLPAGLVCLSFGTKFNQPLDEVKLPEGLQSLTFGYSFNQSLDRVRLPAGLQQLTFGYGFNQSLDHVRLPEGLRQLVFGDDFNASLVGVKLPSGLRQLTFGDYFNSSLVGVELPTGLQRLTFGELFDMPLGERTLPPELKQLNFGFHFNQLFESLPKGLRQLSFCNYNQKRLLKHLTLPAGLKVFYRT